MGWEHGTEGKAHSFYLLLLHGPLEALKRSPKLRPEEYGDGENHHRDRDLPEQEVGMLLDGPHGFKVHTLNKREKSNRHG